MDKVYLNKYCSKWDMLIVHGAALSTLGLFMYGARYFDCAVADGFYTGPTKSATEKMAELAQNHRKICEKKRKGIKDVNTDGVFDMKINPGY